MVIIKKLCKRATENSKHGREGRAFFIAKNGSSLRGNDMREEKVIYCPRCGRKVGTWSKKSTLDMQADCKNCKKRIVYHVDVDIIEVKKIPQRNSSSGMTFY